MSRILKNYLKRLTNLSSRNKSLLLPRLVSEQFVDLHDADFLLNSSSFDLLHQVVQRRKRIALCDVVDPRYEKVNQLSKRLRKIARTVDFIEEERGSRNLFIGFPFVRGKFANGQVVHGPLLFFPVALEVDQGQWCLRSNAEVGPHLNRSFALAYSQFHEVPVSDEILDTDFSDFPANITIFRTELYKWLKESPFDINFNQELFEDRLRPFEALRSRDLELLEKEGELKLQPEAVLGVFPQTGSYLEEDYRYLIQQEIEFEGFEPKEPSTSDFREEDMLSPFAIDSSQEEAMARIKQGENIIVQGPPGTGKSQLICNMMADFAASGKRVLLVCQKRAALDVVHARMHQAGLGDFTALIHDHIIDRSALYQQMARQVENLETYRKENYSIDAVYLEREFLKECRLTDRLVAELKAFKQALFDENIAGVSVKELYLTSRPTDPAVPLHNILKSFPLPKAEEAKRVAAQYFSYALQIGANHGWAKRKNFAELNHIDYQRMQDLLKAWPENFKQVGKQFYNVFSQQLGRVHLIGSEQLKLTLTKLENEVRSPAVYRLFVHYLNKLDAPSFVSERIGEINQLLQMREGVEGYLEAGRLKQMQKKVDDALAARQEVIGGLWWNWFSKDKEDVVWLTRKHGLTLRVEDLQKLSRRIKNRIELEALISDARLYFDSRYLAEPAGVLHQYGLFLDDAQSAIDLIDDLRNSEWMELIRGLTNATNDHTSFLQAVQAGISWVTQWQSLSDEMETWLDPEQLNQIIANPETYAQMLSEQLANDFENLVEMDRIWHQLTSTEQYLFERLQEKGNELGFTQSNEYEKLLDNSVRIAWIDHIEKIYPVLRSVSSLKINQWEEELQRCVRRKQALSGEIVKMKLREEVYGDVTKNRLGNTVTYRELYHQLTKKRRIWPIRKLLSRFSEDVFRLIPCWMVSPESASVIFPMVKDFFDLVIFDEASQCYAEYAIPGAYRGKQVVIAGDSKQLQPTDLYKVRYEQLDSEDEEPESELEVASLLDLAALRLPTHQLTGHYRSLSLDLIQFSNQHFYGGTLRLLPDFQYVNQAEPGIKYHQVIGTWREGTNPVEAEKVIELLWVLKETGKSVGIVTFNYPQQQLIQQLVEESGLNWEGLFVKNIENVQGDERDIILFSIGYAPDETGRLTMQFGTLNSYGGENRLNVAITRAREQIHIVTSLMPHQLKVESARYEGPKLLKSYLEYAKQVSDGEFIPAPTEIKGVRGEWLLKKQLLAHLPEARFELPFADLTLKKDGKYAGLLLTDDDQYHMSRSPKEPHAYLPVLLQQKGWPFKRLYSREFWRNTQPV